MAENKQNEQKFSFSFTQEEVNTILEGLGELKAKVAIPLIGNIQDQFHASVREIQAAAQQPQMPPEAPVQEPKAKKGPVN